MSFPRIFVGAVAALSLAACHRPQQMDEHMSHMAAGDLAATSVAASNNQGNPALPPSANQAAARLAASNRHGEWVKIAWRPGSSDSLMAWVVYPATSNPRTPVVVVVHEIFGLQTWVRGVADQVAADGFIAIAPDLLSRVRGGASTVELSGDTARALIRGVSIAERNEGIDAAARYAMSQPSAAQKYSVIGFCWGGGTVWDHMINGGIQGLSGGVAFYGLPYMNGAVPIGDSLAKIRVPVMMFNGAIDARTGAGMPGVDSAMKALNKSYYGKNFPNAEHGFVRAQDDPKTPPNEVVQQGNLAAIKEAWPQTIAFLKKNMGMM
ncbi:MAG TPA: dienelactone hydrolase family protein [Gemmatimonadaceae bacterium]|jgi:carboxymethylenebutenolidase|nr:dienelactone hydrolase family protein [Gemmatimonadaceae bacterium]